MSKATTKEIVTFENVVPAGTHNNAIGPDYDGLVWHNVGVLDRAYEFPVQLPNGYINDMIGNGIAYNAFENGASFSSPTETFSLKSGMFAAAWETGLHVTFTAKLLGSVVAVKNVILDEASHLIKFSHLFDHIDEVDIATSGGVTVDSARGSGRQVAMDDLKIRFDGTIPGHSALSIDDHDIGAIQHAFLVHDWFG